MIFQWKSKTHWLGAAVGIFGGLQQWVPAVQALMQPEYYIWIFGGITVATIVIRNMTHGSIADK